MHRLHKSQKRQETEASTQMAINVSQSAENGQRSKEQDAEGTEGTRNRSQVVSINRNVNSIYKIEIEAGPHAEG